MGWLDREVVAVWMSRGVKSIGATAVDDRKTGGRFQLNGAKPLQPTRGGRSRQANEGWGAHRLPGALLLRPTNPLCRPTSCRAS